jgi:hypothetical protein
MKDLRGKLEKLLTEAEDCELIARLATDLRSANSLQDWLLTFAAWRAILKPLSPCARREPNKVASVAPSPRCIQAR